MFPTLELLREDFEVYPGGRLTSLQYVFELQQDWARETGRPAWGRADGPLSGLGAKNPDIRSVCRPRLREACRPLL
jgi:hypothetical protein